MHRKWHLKEKLFSLSIVLKIKDLMLIFFKYKLGIEIDEYNHEGRNEGRQLITKKVDKKLRKK